MRKLHSLKLLLSALLLAIGCNVWGDTYTMTLASGDLGTSDAPGTSVTKNNVSWALGWTWKDATKKFIGWDTNSGRGVQIGKGTSNYGGTIVTFTTSEISGTITKVSVNGSVAGSGSGTVSVTVGGASFTYGSNSATTASLTTSAAAYEFTGSASGAIVVTYTNTHNGKAMYAKEIVVTYSSAPANPCTVTFNLGDNGSFASSETFDEGTTNQRTEASAGAGVALPDVTANANYAFKGWSTANPATATTLVSAGADSKYHPSANTPLYAYYVATYTLTITQPAAGGTLTVKNGETILATGATVEVGTELTCEVTNIPEGKRFSRFYAKWDNDESKYKATNPATFDNIATEDITACEIYVTYQDLGKFTINYMVNGVNTNPQENVWENTALVFPTVDDIAGKVFRGWIADEPIDGTTDVEPTWVSTVGLTAKANKTYYAVFATETGTPSTDYAKITSMADLTDNDYVVAYDYNGGTQIVMGNTAKGTNQINASALSLTDSKYANPDADYIWSIKKVMDGENTYYTLYNADAEKYAKAVSAGATLEDDAYNFTITWDNTNKCFRIRSTKDNTYYLHGYVNNDTGYDFRSSTSGSGAKYHLHLYKNESTVVYSAYCTTIAYTLTTADNDFYSLYLPYEVAIPDGIEAYTGELDGNNLNLTAVVGNIPAETAVLVKSTTTPGEYTFSLSNTGASISATNSLKGVVVATSYADLATANPGKTILILGTLSDESIGFCKPYESDTHLAANRAYLPYVSADPNPAPVRIVMEQQVVTALENAEANQEATKLFINGQLYIVREGKTYDMVGNLIK